MSETPQSSFILNLLARQALQVCQNLFPCGKQIGRKFFIGDISGSAGDSLEVVLDGAGAGFWIDRGAGNHGGTLLNLIAEAKGIQFTAAMDWARAFLGLEKWKPNSQFKPPFDPLKKPWRCAQVKKDIYGTAAFQYRSLEGHLIGYTVRFEIPVFDTDGKPKKDIIPLRHDNGVYTWKAFWEDNSKRPFYGQEHLKAKPDAPVLVVEGEKKRDAAAKMFPDFVVLSPLGGTANYPKANWPLLRNRKAPVVLWPDNDKAGKKAVLYPKALIKNSVIVKLPDGLPDKWDLADPIPPGIDPRGLLDAAILEATQPKETNGHQPFRFLGKFREEYFYLPESSRTIIRLNARSHDARQMFQLAPLDWWEAQEKFLTLDRTKVDWQRAANWAIQEQSSLEIFRPQLVRGRGCWIDEDRVVYHCGSHLLIDGRRSEVAAIKSRFVYERTQSLEFPEIEPCSAKSVRELLEVFKTASWVNRDDAVLYLGVLVQLITCGAMPFRVPAWIVGGAGSGKTTMALHVMRRLLAPRVLMVQLSSSEAGIRMALGSDALGVAQDEAEAETEQDEIIQQRNLMLARASFSDTDAQLIKGTTTGSHVSYALRSAFLFSSIISSATNAADKSRFVILAMRKSANREAFIEFERYMRGLPKDFGDRFCARCVASVKRAILMHPHLVDGVFTYSGDQRTSDKFGNLLACAISVLSDETFTGEAAAKQIDALELSHHLLEAKQVDDNSRCLRRLWSHVIRIGADERTIGELVIRSRIPVGDAASHAQDTLNRHGIRVTRGKVLVQHDSAYLNDVFEGTPWSQGRYSQMLSNLPDAENHIKTAFFQNQCYATRFPIPSDALADAPSVVDLIK